VRVSPARRQRIQRSPSDATQQFAGPALLSQRALNGVNHRRRIGACQELGGQGV
jgi:hypothetical protein